MRSIHLVLFFIFLSVTSSFAGKVRIQGTVRNFAGDALTCTVVGSGVVENFVKRAIPMQKGSFSDQIEVADGALLSFSDGTNYFAGFVQAGDSIVIQYDYLDFNRSIAYLGRGKEKFEIAYAINQIKSFPRKQAAAAKNTAYPVDYLFGKLDSLKALVSEKIDKTGSLMNKESSFQLTGYLHANVLHAKVNALVAIFGDPHDVILKSYPEKLSSKSVSDIHQLLKFDESLHRSRIYVSAVRDIMEIYLDENVRQQVTDFQERKYQYLYDRLPPKLRTPVIFMTLDRDIKTNKGIIGNAVFLNALNLLEDSDLKKILMDKIGESDVINSGSKAPEFSLQNLAGEKVNLSSFAGKTVYMDFWFAACGPCHMLFKAVEPVKKHFETDDRVVFLVVSVDDEKTWKKAITKFGVKGYHVFTENKFRDHPIIQSYQVGQYPTTYIINPKGEFHSVNPSGNPEILKQQITEALEGKPAR